MSVVSYKCPHCGGGMKFIPGKGFKCEYCLSVMTQEELDAAWKDEVSELDEAPSDDEQPAARPAADGSDSMVNSCPSCGAEVITDAKTAATTCHYCHNPVVLSSNLKGDFKPDKVIAFDVSKDKAGEMFKQHCSGKFFLPKDFYSESSIENLFGVYYPYWIVDASVHGRYTARGEIEHATRVGDDRKVDITVHDILREGDLELNNMTSLATGSEDAELLEYVLPFKLEKMLDFSMAYLSGFRAEKRTIEKAQMKPEIEKKKQEYAEQLLSRDANKYTRKTNEKTAVTTKSEDWKYALLPVWILVYKYAGQTYMFGINGQTGKSYGGLPVDKRKLTLFSVIVGIIAALIGFFIGRALL